MNPTDYFTPPTNFSIEPLEGLIKIGIMVQIIVGIALILFALIYLVKIGFKAFKGQGDMKKEIILFTVALTIGMILMSNAWVKVLEVQNNAITNPAQNILNEHNHLDQNNEGDK